MAVLCKAIESTLIEMKRAMDGESTLNEGLEDLVWSLA